MSGRNVYGILRAGRALGTESIVLSVPLLEEGRNHHGIAVTIALAQYFQSKMCTVNENCFLSFIIFRLFCNSAKNYWAKDLIFLVTSQNEVGMQAWIDSYMGIHSGGEENKEKEKKKFRSRQDSNLRGQSPMDF